MAVHEKQGQKEAEARDCVVGGENSLHAFFATDTWRRTLHKHASVRAHAHTRAHKNTHERTHEPMPIFALCIMFTSFAPSPMANVHTFGCTRLISVTCDV